MTDEATEALVEIATSLNIHLQKIIDGQQKTYDVLCGLVNVLDEKL